jgi:hypothetical protein
MLEIPLRSAPRRRTFVEWAYGNRRADFRETAEREEK